MSFKTDKIYETTLTSETEKKQETSKVTKPKSKTLYVQSLTRPTKN